MASNKHDAAHEPDTTGHEWDGIRELNKPLPKWWLYTFYATIVWAIGYWLLMPAWPLVATYTKGMLGYSQREVVAEELQDSKAAKAEFRQKIVASDLAAINNDPELLSFALAGGEAAFGDNCAPCHGRGAQGAFGYPNLRDDSWLWGGSLDAIHQTITHGIRAGAKIFVATCAPCHGPEGRGNPALGAPDLSDQLWLYGGDKATIASTIRGGRAGVMPAWGSRLDPETIKELAIYVHSLGGGL